MDNNKGGSGRFCSLWLETLMLDGEWEWEGFTKGYYKSMMFKKHGMNGDE